MFLFFVRNILKMNGKGYIKAIISEMLQSFAQLIITFDRIEGGFRISLNE